MNIQTTLEYVTRALLDKLSVEHIHLRDKMALALLEKWASQQLTMDVFYIEERELVCLQTHLTKDMKICDPIQLTWEQLYQGLVRNTEDSGPWKMNKSTFQKRIFDILL